MPMADAPAQLFTVLTLTLGPAGHAPAPGSSGAAPGPFSWPASAFAWAYWIRHTQLVLVLPVVLAARAGSHAALQAHSRSEVLPLGSPPCVLRCCVFFGAALVAALPDIVYRWRTFGGPLATETTELPLMALQHIGPVAWQMLRDALVAGEWGYLFPLALYGGYRLARDRRREAIVLASAFWPC